MNNRMQRRFFNAASARFTLFVCLVLMGLNRRNGSPPRSSRMIPSRSPTLAQIRHDRRRVSAFRRQLVIARVDLTTNVGLLAFDALQGDSPLDHRSSAMSLPAPDGTCNGFCRHRRPL